VATFPKPDIPRAVNVHGLPQPPSGLHPSTSPAALLTPTNGLPPVGLPSDVPAANIHGSPAPPSGFGGRVAAIARAVRGSYDVLDSVR
jgi:hypothetical protein